MITFTLFRQYLALLRKRKINLDNILVQSSITKLQLEDPNCRMSAQQHDELWDILLNALPEPQLALKNNDTLAPASFSSLMYLAMSHQQAIDALTTLLNYKNQDSDIQIQLQQTKHTVQLSFNADLFQLRHWQYFLLLAAQHILDVLSWLKNEPVSPMIIQVPKNLPASFAQFLESLTPCIKISEGPPMLVFDIKQLQFPLTGSHPNVRAILEQQTKHELLQFQPHDNLINELTRYFVQCFQSTYTIENLKISLTLDKAAQHFVMTSRTLQRKLKQHASSYSTILDKVRLHRYEQGLQQKLKGEDLAEFCGFNDINSVQRFAKRLVKHSLPSIK